MRKVIIIPVNNEWILKAKRFSIYNNEYSRERYIMKRKLYIIQYINQNLHKINSFITLTFKDQEKAIDKKWVLKRFHDFTTMIRRVKKDFSYIMVLERTKKGVYHIHMISNINEDWVKYSKNDERININIEANDKKAVGNYWSYGFINFQIITNKQKAINYLMKYITKDNKLKGERLFYTSRDVKLYQIVIIVNNIKEFFKNIINLTKITYIKICDLYFLFKIIPDADLQLILSYN